MKTLRWITLSAALVVALPLLLDNVWWSVTNSMSDPTYIGDQLSVDEVFVLGAAKSVYEGGYFGLSFRKGHTGSAYGGTQAYLDALTLKLVPQGWLEGVETYQGPVFPWPELVRYPRMLEVLRWTRTLYAVALIVALGAAGAYYSRDWIVGAIFALAAGSSPIFASAVSQGAKNDFPSALWEVGFLLLALGFFGRLASARRPEPSRFLAVYLTGFFGGFVRLILLPLDAIFLASYGAVALLSRVPPRRVARDLLAAAGLTVILYFALHPNTFVSSTEANWPIPMFNIIRRPGNSATTHAQLLVALQAAWLWVLVFAALARRARSGGLRALVLTNGFVAVAGAFLFYANFKSTTPWPFYYLPAYTLLLTWLATLWPRGDARASQRLGAALAAAVILVDLVCVGSPRASWNRLATRRPTPRTLVDVVINNEGADVASGSWLIDTALRAPLRRGVISEDAIMFFDTVSQSPGRVLKGLGADTEGGRTRVLAACWNANDSALRGTGLDSPETRLWAALLRPYCKTTESVTPATFSPFVEFNRARAFVVVPARELVLRARGLKGVAEFRGEKLSPRVLEGSTGGMDNFWMPLVLDRSTVLSTTLVFPRGVKSASLPIESSCKDPADSVTLKVATPSRSWTTGAVGLDVSVAFCRDFPSLCGYDWFRRWSERRFAPQRPVRLGLEVGPGERATIEIRTTQGSCRLVLGELALTPQL